MEQRVCDGRYEIQRKLGEGSQAEVFAGLDRQLMRQVAVKVYRKREGDEQNLAKEAQLLKELQHPMLPALYDVSEEGCLIMEYLGGGSLREYVERNGALDEKKAGELALALLQSGEAGSVCLQAENGRLVPHWQESRQPAAQ